MSNIIRTSESLIVNAKRKAEVGVLFYPPYYATELERPVGAECELLFTPSAIRRPAYFDGLLKALQVMNIDYNMIDLTKASAETLLRYKQVWAFSTDEMNAVDQQTLVDYTRAGGQLVVFPYLPDREMSQKPCTILRDSLPIAPSGREIIDSPLVDVFDLKDIKCSNPLIIYPEGSLSGAEIIARTLNGTACGFLKALGNGTVIHLGTWIGFDTEADKPVYETILKRSGAKLRQASSNNDFIVVRERFTVNQEGLLFVGNYYNEEQKGNVSYTHPESGETITIPFLKGDLLWPALYAILTPLCMEVCPGLKILHTTSDILGMECKAGQVEIILYGDRDLAGEIVFEGANVNRIGSATINGVAVKMARSVNRVAILYSHAHREKMILKYKPGNEN
jgi:beta-galactosidase